MQTSLRVDTETVEALRVARAELVAASRFPLSSDDDTLVALMAYWDANKGDTHGLKTAPVLASGGVPAQAHQSQQ